jgi:hypothetical protein
VRGSQYLLRAEVTSLAIWKTIDGEMYVQNEVDVVRKQLRGREGAHYISSARPHHACRWHCSLGRGPPECELSWPFPPLGSMRHGARKDRLAQERRLRVRRSCLGITSHCTWCGVASNGANQVEDAPEPGTSS